MEKALQLANLPGALDYLTDARPRTRESRGNLLVGRSKFPVLEPSVTGATAVRLTGLAQIELAQDASYVNPKWLEGQSVPRLLISAKYEGSDAFGSSRLMADLDLSARRAGALFRKLANDGQAKGWPTPMRTYEGGLRTLDIRPGSLEVVMTFWGSLVMLASSSPVAVAGMMSLAWDVGRGSLNLANRWVGAAISSAHEQRPSLDRPVNGEQWGIRHTKALAPVLEAAAATGSGAELVVNEVDRTVKLSVLPRVTPPGNDD